MSNRRLVSVAAMWVLSTTMCGCGYVKGIVNDIRPPLLSRDGKRIDGGGTPDPRVYPQQATLGEPLDIEVIRTGNGIEIDNRTVQPYGSLHLWLNQEYGATVEAVEIGRGERIALRSFTNRHQERYPVAKFLEPDADQELIAAELLIDGKLHPLVVRLSDDWREP